MAGRPRLSIPTRIFLGFVLVLTAFVSVAVASLLQHERTAQTLRLLHEGYLPLALNVGEARATQAVFATLLDRVLQERDTTATRSWLSTARRVRPATLKSALDGVSRLETFDSSATDRQTIARVRRELVAVQRAFAEGDAQYNELFHTLEAGDHRQAAQILASLRARERTIQTRLRNAFTELQGRISTTSAGAAEQERQAAIWLGVLVLLALGIGLAVTVFTQRVLKPLPLLHERVQAVAKGDFSRRLESTREDELGRLTREFERMVDAISARDARLREAAEAQRRLQRMQEQIVAGLSAAVVVVDGEGVVRTINPAAGDVLELHASAIGASLRALGTFDRLPDLEAAIARVAHGEERAVLTAARLEGTARSVNVLLTPFGVGDEADRARSVLLVAEDVTEELETKSRLIQTERLAAIGKMAAHVTHEVRNPLSSIGLNVEILEEELRDAGPEVKALVRAVQGEIDRLTAITEEYLRLARLPVPRLEPEDMGELVAQVTRFVAIEMRGAGIVIETTSGSELPPVAVDEGQLRQALLNLLRNAREAMPAGGTIHVHVARVGDGVSIAIEDEGHGIPDVERDRIFDLFYTTKERGTGLGLPLTQQIVVAHGGEISCEARPGRGTRFSLWLPAARAPRDSERPETLAEPALSRRSP